MNPTRLALLFRTMLPLAVMAGTVTACATAPMAAASERLAAGKGTFTFDGWKGPALPVWYHIPARVTAATPIVFVMHGRGRDPDRYRNEWSALAEANGFILAVPGFSNADFPGSISYNHGGFQDTAGTRRPRDVWAFAAIDPLFEEIRARTGSRVRTFAIYGHSAGAQFVHRYALFTPEARFHAAVSANAGSYAMPDFAVDYPFGLGKSPVDERGLRRALGKPMVVLLGTADIDPNHDSLPREPQAMAQGPFRMARGQAFFGAAQAKAAELKTPFRWQLRYADKIGHSNGGMAAFAAPLLGKTMK